MSSSKSSLRPLSGEAVSWQRWELAPLDTPKPDALAGVDLEALAQALEAGALPTVEEAEGVEDDTAGGDEPAGEEEPSPPSEDVTESVQLAYPTAAELEAIHQEAYQAGFAAGEAEGHSAGRQAGRDEVVAELRPQLLAELQALEALRTALDARVAALDAEVAPQLSALALSCAQRIVADHVRNSAHAIEPLLRPVLAGLGRQWQQARLRVHPDDLALVQTVTAREAAEVRWQFVADPFIERGGCLLEGPSGRMDLTLAARWAALQDALGVEPLPVDPLPSEPDTVIQHGSTV